MKKVNIFTAMLAATGVLFLVSCNSGDDKKVDETKNDTTSTTTDATPPSGPTSFMVGRIKVTDYAKWKVAYESHDSVRRSFGLHNYVLGRGTEDSNMVLVASVMDDVAKAREFGASPELKERMKKSGVIESSFRDFVHTVLNDTSSIQATVRLMARHKVKDWDTFKKAFDKHKQARIDAGLVDRVIAYTDGDNHNVTLVFAITDMEKAKAFMSSEDLKNKMNEAGVDGPPDFFYYKVAHKY